MHSGEIRCHLFAFFPRRQNAFGLMVASWTTLIFLSPGVWLGLLCLVGLAAGATLTAFCVQHDANHGAYFTKRRYNHLMGWTADALLGFSSYAWRVKHNVAHHTYTNVDDYDDDISQVPFARFMPQQKALLVLAAALLHLAHVHADGAALADGRRRRRVRPRQHRPQPAPRAEALGPRRPRCREGVLHRLGARGADARLPSGGRAVGAYVLFAMIMPITATTFQLAHCVEEADFRLRRGAERPKRVWAVHEVETTVDFCPRNPVLTWCSVRRTSPSRR